MPQNFAPLQSISRMNINSLINNRVLGYKISLSGLYPSGIELEFDRFSASFSAEVMEFGQYVEVFPISIKKEEGKVSECEFFDNYICDVHPIIQREIVYVEENPNQETIGRYVSTQSVVPFNFSSDQNLLNNIFVASGILIKFIDGTEMVIKTSSFPFALEFEIRKEPSKQKDDWQLMTWNEYDKFFEYMVENQSELTREL